MLFYGYEILQLIQKYTYQSNLANFWIEESMWAALEELCADPQVVPVERQSEQPQHPGAVTESPAEDQTLPHQTGGANQLSYLHIRL